MKNAFYLIISLGVGMVAILFLVTYSVTERSRIKPLTHDDYSVYSAYINGFSFYKNVPSAGIIITDSTTNTVLNAIDSTTSWSWIMAYSSNYYRNSCDTVPYGKTQESAWAALFEQLKQLPQNEHTALQLTRFTVTDSLRLLSQLHGQRPDPPLHGLSYYVLSVSRIVYDKDKTKAMFFSTFVCGDTCGRGELVRLEKVGKNWRLIDTFKFWIA